MGPILIDGIKMAAKRINASVRKTPLVHSPLLSERSGTDVFLKLEHQQFTGSFKLRGASNAVANLSNEQRRAGVVGVSTGNHGKGLARACRMGGTKCIICMSDLVPDNKRRGIELEGAEIRIAGHSQDDAEREALRLCDETGMMMIPPFDHKDVIAGQGTLGLETLEQLPKIDTAIIPLSGGGLLSGVATSLKADNPETHIIGVTMERGAAMYQCIQAGHYVEVEEVPTLADSLGGGIGEDNRYTFNLVRELVDQYVLVSEQEIRDAMRYAWWQEGQMLEGSGSVTIAALLSGKATTKGNTVLYCCGGNIDPHLHARIVGGEEVDIAREKS